MTDKASPLVRPCSKKKKSSWRTESLVDSAWQSVSKITLDLPWRPARAGRQEERESKGEKEREKEGGGGRRRRPGGTCHNDKPGL